MVIRGYLPVWRLIWELALGAIAVALMLLGSAIKFYVHAWRTDLPEFPVEAEAGSLLSEAQATATAREYLSQTYCPVKLRKLQRHSCALLKRNWSGNRYVWHLSFEHQIYLRQRLEENTVTLNARTGRIEFCSWEEYYASQVEVSPERAVAMARKYAAANGWRSAESCPAHVELHVGTYPTVVFEPEYIGVPVSMIWWTVSLNVNTPGSLVCVDIYARDGGAIFNIQILSAAKRETDDSSADLL